MSFQTSRRDLLKWTGLGLGAACLPHRSLVAAETPARQRVLRLAHLTDMHIQPERAAAEGVSACLEHVQSLPDPPQLILTGGDTVMDSLAAPQERAKLQWDLWANTLKNSCSIEVQSCLGNHDCWGWDQKRSQTTGKEPLWGKAWACEMFGIERPYRSFDKAGWHFIVLDSMVPHAQNIYSARLDDEQWEWLQSDLAAASPETPVLVISHIPILSACVLSGWKGASEQNLSVSHSLMHTDVARIGELFWRHKNVKLCLSGHLHLRERVEYNGVTYLCNGAVCGGWWNGAHRQTQAGYGVVDLYDDGTFTDFYQDYGWQPRS